jgi:hypothetical protein
MWFARPIVSATFTTPVKFIFGLNCQSDGSHEVSILYLFVDTRLLDNKRFCPIQNIAHLHEPHTSAFEPRYFQMI